MDDYTAEQMTGALNEIVEELHQIRMLMDSQSKRRKGEFAQILAAFDAITPLVDAGVTVGYNNDHKEAIGRESKDYLTRVYKTDIYEDDRNGQGGGTD